MCRPGDRCKCGGLIGVYSTRINFARQIRIRYMRCRSCGSCPENNKWIVPLEYAPAQALATDSNPR